MAHTQPEVTVSICLHNSAAFIDATLASALAQTFGNFEILLVDDGSTDGTLGRVAERFKDPRIRAVAQAHAGLGAARVTSTAAARGRFLAFLDHDDLWEPDKLAAQLDLIDTRPDVGLVFCPCTYIDAEGRRVDSPAPHLEPWRLDLSATGALDALLRCGCFIELSTVLMPKAVLERIGGFNPGLTYVEDFDLWLRVARRMALACVPRPLVRRRLHARQFTQLHPDVALAEERALLRQVVAGGTYPHDLRQAVATILSGEHCACASRLFALGRYASGVKAAVGALAQPGGARLAGAYWSSRTAMGRFVRDRVLGKRKRQQDRGAPSVAPATQSSAITEVWVDATPLDSAQTGYFGFTLDLLRVLLRRCPAGVDIHADVPEPVIARLADWLGSDASRLLVHPLPPALELRRNHRSSLREGGRGILEILIWQGCFRFAQSERVAIIHDVTPRLMPGVHTPGNILDFEDYVRYTARHATRIATISRNSQRDIIDHLPVYPRHVHVIPQHVHPRFEANPEPLSPAARARLGIAGPYVLTVGTIEPRKNLRLLVDGYATATGGRRADGLLLVIAGPQGWDDGFPSYVANHPRRSDVLQTGFVEAEDLPGLYAGASVFVCASLYEGFGRPVFEAMCCGCLTLASRVSAIPEVLGEAGLYFDPHDVGDLARALAEALEMPVDRAQRYREAARRRARDVLAAWTAVPPLPGLDGWR